jgi:hypothetical protein
MVAFCASRTACLIDEYGFSDWEDWKAQPTLIPCRVRKASLHYPVDRQIRHQALVGCITAAIDANCPLLFSADGSVTQVFEAGVRDRLNLKIELASSPMSGMTFLRGTWMTLSPRPSFPIGGLPDARTSRLFYYATKVLHPVPMKF